MYRFTFLLHTQPGIVSFSMELFSSMAPQMQVTTHSTIIYTVETLVLFLYVKGLFGI